MNILVFGGSGFLGSHVVDALIDSGHAVTVFDKNPSSYLKNRGEMIIGSIMDTEAVSNVVRGQEVVYNFAGFADLNESINFPVATINLNVMGNLNILEACRNHKINRFVYASSAYVFSDKGAFYGTSKKCSELIIDQYSKLFDLDYTIIRYGSVYGERADSTNRIYNILKEAVTQKKITFPGNGTEEREYIHGRDAAQLSVDILDPAYCNQHIILTGVQKLKYYDLLKLVNEILGNNLEIQFLNEDYKGHYIQTPYSFAPTVGVKLTNNPCVDFGQGLLECIEHIYHELRTEDQKTQLPGDKNQKSNT